MPPPPPQQHRRQQSTTTAYSHHPRPSSATAHTLTGTSSSLIQPAANPAPAPAPLSSTKTRQYAHLHSQLAQLNAHLADMENLMRMTAAQAGNMRFLGGYVGGLFMGAAKVLGEEGEKGEKGAGGVKKEGEGEDV
ncbi:hypothetical protein FQN50_006446 [Emmonsiellopsis sp. PD_5]|nr:hypothetical protein FQN50_006446 [Emmonsiellopsis sp. PD_5]